MNVYKFSGMLILCFLGISCSNSPKPTSFKAKTNDKLVKIDVNNSTFKKAKLDKSSIRVIPLEGTPPLGKISKIIFYDNSYYIKDNKLTGAGRSLTRFDYQGKYLNHFGAFGNGPGEYIDIMDFDIDQTKGEVLIYSNGKRTILKYDQSGSFLGDIKIDFWASKFRAWENGYLFYTSSINAGSENHYAIINVDKKGNINKSNFKLSNPHSMSFGPIGFILKLNNGSLLSNPGVISDTVYTFSSNGTISPTFILDFGENSLPSEMRDNSNIFMQKSLSYSFLTNHTAVNNEGWIFSYWNSLENKMKSRLFYCYKNRQLYSINNQNDFILSHMSNQVYRKDDSTFLSFLDPAVFVAELRKNENMRWMTMQYPKEYKILKGVEETDNPVLIEFSLSL